MSYNLIIELLPASKIMTEEVAIVCMNDEGLLEELVTIAFSEEKIISWHACWVIEKIARKDKSVLIKFTDLFIKELPSLKHPSQIRPILCAITLLEFDCEIHLNLLDFCVERLTNSKAPYNEKARSILILEKFIRFEPGLKNELFPIIEPLLLFEVKPHFVKKLIAFLAV